MRCIVPTCNNDDSSCISQGNSFHKFPKEPSLCTAWLKALNKEDWKPFETSVVCSNHFIKNDLYMGRDGQCKLRAGAIPIVNLQNVPYDDGWITSCDIKVCRTCLATDCNLYPMTMYKNLDQAYETLTGLSIENEDDLTAFLCVECAQRLLNCIQFRTKSLKANLILLDIITKHDRITLESLKSINGNQSFLKSNLNVTHNPPNRYDLQIKHVNDENTESIETIEQMVPKNTFGLAEDIIYRIKLENDTLNQRNSVEDVSNDMVYIPSLQVDFESIKTENDDAFIECINTENHDNYGNDVPNDTMYLPSLQVEVECIKTENDDIFNEGNLDVEDEAKKDIMHSDVLVGPYYSSQDNVPVGDEEQKAKCSARKVKKNTNVLLDKKSRRFAETDDKLLRNDKLSCEMCPYQTNNESRLRNHLKAHATELLKCNKCNYETVNKKDIKVHIRTHSVEKKLSCYVCKKFFKLKCNLKRHMRLHTDEKPYACDVCKKTFRRQDNCKIHLTIHSNEKPFPCDICSKTFSRQQHYKDHLDTHSGEKPYSCDVCKQLFTRKSNLQNHMKLHYGEKRFSCEICSRTFYRNNNLQKHVKLHGRKPFSCDVCKKCFIRKSELKIHLRLHVHGRPYTCVECNKTFNFKSSLRSHLRKHF